MLREVRLEGLAVLERSEAWLVRETSGIVIF